MRRPSSAFIGPPNQNYQGMLLPLYTFLRCMRGSTTSSQDLGLLQITSVARRLADLFIGLPLVPSVTPPAAVRQNGACWPAPFAQLTRQLVSQWCVLTTNWCPPTTLGNAAYACSRRALRTGPAWLTHCAPRPPWSMTRGPPARDPR